MSKEEESLIKRLKKEMEILEENQQVLLEAVHDYRTLAIYYKQRRRPPDSMWQKLQNHEHFVNKIRRGER